MRHLLIFIFTFSLSFSYGQNFSYPLIKIKAQNFVDFVPAGWKILDTAYGDLNKDGIKDAAIILQTRDSVIFINSDKDTVVTQPRILIILFKNKSDNNFHLAEQSNTFILKHDNPVIEDPYKEMMINKGVLQIKFQIFHNMGSWYITNGSYKFRYNQSQFFLIGADYFSFHRATMDFEDYSYNFLAKKRSLTKGNDNNGTKKTTWKSLKIPTLKTLKNLIEPFTWKVETDVYL